jgi:hypothetical protein
MALGLGLAWRLVGCGVAGDEREALPPRGEAVTTQAAPDAVVRDEQAAPALAPELSGDAGGTESGVTESEGDDPALDQRGELVGHARPAPLPRAQDLQSMPLDHPLPAVVGGAVDPESAAGGRNSDAAGQVDELQPVAERGRHPQTCGSLLSSDLVVEGEGEPRNGRHPVTKAGCHPLKPLSRVLLSEPHGDSPD